MLHTQLSIRDLLARFRADESGGVLVYMGIMLAVLLGVGGMSVDIGLWYMHKRVVQSTADAAAVAGALESKRSNGSSAAILQAATDSAAENGFNGAGGGIMTLNEPPASGAFAGQAGAVEVIVERPAQTYLAGLLFDEPVTVVARAVASAGVNDACVWALDPSVKSAVKVSGGAQVNLPCGVIANSTHSEALTQSGASCLTADGIYTVGGYSGSCIDPAPDTGLSPVNDPFQALAPPTYGGCDSNANIKANNGHTVDMVPGVYCGKLTVSMGGTMNFDGGLYVLDGAPLTIHGTVTGNGVTFYLTASSGQNDNITVNAGANVTLSAPADGELAGVLFFQDRAAPAGVNHNFTGQASMSLEGILYFPNQDLLFAGGSSFDPTASFIVANTVSFTGDTEMASVEGSVVESNPQLTEVTLLE